MKLLRTSVWVDDAFLINVELIGLDPGSMQKKSIRFTMNADTARGFEDKLHHEINMALRNEPRRVG